MAKAGVLAVAIAIEWFRGSDRQTTPHVAGVKPARTQNFDVLQPTFNDLNGDHITL